MNIQKLTLFFILISASATAQEYAGTWIGNFNTYSANSRRSFHFSLQLQQQGRAVWGVYTTGDNMQFDKADCVCRVSGQLGKNNKTVITLNKDGVIQGTMSEEACDQVNYLEAQYLEKDNKISLSGSWFGNNSNVALAGGASGTFMAQKVSDSAIVAIDKYFPKLKKMIEKSNPGDPKYAAGAK